jgi:holo-[acyl-carrier protein] synthase
MLENRVAVRLHRKVMEAGARVGVDLVAVARFQRRFEGRDALLGEMFTPFELDYCRAQKNPWMHLAARFAAKEAALKALGTGLSGGMTWRDVEVRRDPAGAPSLAFSGATREALSLAKFNGCSVSLSHTLDQAIAVVLLFPHPLNRDPSSDICDPTSNI